MPKGKAKNANIVSTDILINSIARVPGHFGVDTNLTPKITLVRTRHAANKFMSHNDTRVGFSGFLKSSDGNSFLGEPRKKFFLSPYLVSVLILYCKVYRLYTDMVLLSLSYSCLSILEAMSEAFKAF